VSIPHPPVSRSLRSHTMVAWLIGSCPGRVTFDKHWNKPFPSFTSEPSTTYACSVDNSRGQVGSATFLSALLAG